MQFLLSDEQLSMQSELRRLLETECDTRRVHTAFDTGHSNDDALWRALTDFGISSMPIGDGFGGLGMELIDLALVAEMLGRFAAPCPFLGNAVATIAVSLCGNEDQKRRWLSALATGEVTGAFAPRHAGTVSGRMEYVPHGAGADIIVTELDDGGLGLIEAAATSVETRSMNGIDRTRPIYALSIPADAITPLSERSCGLASRVRDAALILLAADAYGGAMRCVEMATAYACQREQFGVPIAEFQALRHQLANMALLAEPGRGLWWFAAHAFDHLPDQAELAAAQAKAHLTETFLQVARDNIEVHGGIGYTWEADPQIWLKRAMFDFAWLGAPAVHRARAADLAGW